MTGYPFIGNAVIVKSWLVLALILAVAVGAFQAGMLYAAKPPECLCKMVATVDCDCHYEITGPVGKVEIRPVDQGRFNP